jgi:succinyl-CoA synthetase beta subunit
MQLAEERAPNGFTTVDDVISRRELDAIVVSFSKAAGLDVETVNHRPSYISQQEPCPDIGF